MRKLFLFILFIATAVVSAQKTLTVEEAVNIALKNNFDLFVARNDATIAKLNNTLGNAGMLPKIEMIGAGSLTQNSVHQKLNAGAENSNSSLSTSLVSAGTQLSWTLFDGGKMFVTKNKLNEIQSLGEIQFKEHVLLTLYQVIASYYDVVRQQQQLISIQEALNYNRERVSIAQAGFNAGSLLKSDLLMAKIDMNVTMENAINQQFTIEAARKKLNQLLGEKTTESFQIADSIPINYSPNKEELIRKLNSSNTSILSFQKQIEIAQLGIKEYKSAYLPQVNFKTGYYLSQTNNSQGTVLNNFSYGPQIGGTVVIPLYNAGENKRKVSTAKIQVQSAEYDLQNITSQVNTEFENAITQFQNQQLLLKMESENYQLAKENIQISLERLRLGQTNSLEVRQAQEDFVQSCTRLINFKYTLKIAETKLKQLVSEL